MEYVKRWVVTYKNKYGDRCLFDPKQGRFTYEAQGDAQARIDALRANTPLSTWNTVGADPDTLELRLVDCWPVHFDPVGLYV